MLTNPTLVDRVRYTLIHEVLGRKEINEPLNYKTDYRSWTRNGRHGFTTSYPSSGEYAGEAAEYIQMVIDTFGANTKLIIEKDVKDPKTDIFDNEYRAELDLINASNEDGILKVNNKTGGIERYLAANESAKVELTRVRDLKGDLLYTVPTSSLLLDSRRIFLVSNYGINEDYEAKTQNIIYTANPRNLIWNSPIPFLASSTGVPYTVSPIPSGETDTIADPIGAGTPETGSSSFCFVFNSEEDKRYGIKAKIKGTVKATRLGYLTTHYRIRLITYSNGSDLDIVKRENLWYQLFTNNVNGASAPDINGNTVRVSRNINQTISFEINIDKEIDLLEGESLGIVIESFPFADFNPSQNISDTFVQTYDKCSFLQVTEDSEFRSTACKAYRLHDVMRKVSKIVTNNGGFVSHYLNSGFPKDMVVANGFLIRGFNSSDETFKPIETSFKSLDESINAIFGTGITVEKINNTERVVLEDRDYFYQNHIAARLTDMVTNEKRYPASDMYFSGVEAGYKEGGDYSESVGLNEYNTQSNYATEIDAHENVYSIISDLRADSYGVEFARRKQKDEFPTEDTSYDDDNFLFSTKLINGRRYLKRYQDVLTELPTGVFSPETAYNLELTPLNNLKRHSGWISSGLSYDDNAEFTYISGDSAVKLSTSLGIEKSNVTLQQVGYSKFLPQIIEFNYPVTHDLIKHLESTRIYNGRETLNIYGRLVFRTSRGDEAGWILDFNPEGTFKILISK